MQRLDEVTVFATGDSGKRSTWSNVPYFFTRALEEKGIRVNRVDLSPSSRLHRLWSETAGRLIRLLNRRTTFGYFRSLVHFLDVRLRIRRALRAFPRSGANIFLTFSFGAAPGRIPTVLFCDWTYQYYLTCFEGRPPDLFERQAVMRENRNIESADLVFSMFPGVAKSMAETYRNRNISYLGSGVNSDRESSEVRTLDLKSASGSILFVGGPRYLAGARALVSAFRSLAVDFPSLELHIIGLGTAQLGNEAASNMHFHGYLDKDKTADRDRYYELIEEAKVFVNTTPKWGAFSATIEALHHYTPVVVMPYSGFVETFGREIDFGVYCSSNNPNEVASSLRILLGRGDYRSMCINAHRSVAGFTWNFCTSRMLERIEAIDRSARTTPPI
jgi:glycosyltransferase involved in cell wall biosynthesis